MRPSAVSAIAALALGAALVACAPALPSGPALTPPPAVGRVEPWPLVRFAIRELPPDAGMLGRSLLAVAHADPGFVAVGNDNRGPSDEGLVAFADDGLDWNRVETASVFAGVSLVDVAAGGPGFVAIGGTVGDPAERTSSRALVFTSRDGRAWERVADDAPPGAWYATGVAAGPGGLIAYGNGDPGGTFAWLSEDGRTWDHRPLADLGLDGATWNALTSDGAVWLAGGTTRQGNRTVPAVFRSTDGRTWETEVLSASRDGMETAWVASIAIGRWGSIARGVEAAPCSPMASCAGSHVWWWSRDGDRWGVVPNAGDRGPHPAAALAQAGDRGFLAIGGASALASPDGWSWSAVGDAGTTDVSASDLIVVGDRIVAVGRRDELDGSSIATVLVGGPDVEPSD